MSKGSQLNFHIHNGALFTGIYYPLLPEDATDLVVIDPEQRVRSPVTSQMEEHQLERKSKDDNRERKSIHIKEGHAYVFPGWLEHGPLNNICDKRISINFNVPESENIKLGGYISKGIYSSKINFCRGIVNFPN